jgi:hypothetical protein
MSWLAGDAVPGTEVCRVSYQKQQQQQQQQPGCVDLTCLQCSQELQETHALMAAHATAWGGVYSTVLLFAACHSSRC